LQLDSAERIPDTEEAVSSLGQIRHSSLRAEARRAIRAGVITGEIQPGEIYSASSLAESLGVSATPVREALIDLANAGLVEAVRNRGFRVVVLNDSDLDEIFEIRTLLEVPSVGRVAGNLPPEQAEQLHAVLVDLESAAEAEDLPRYLTADQAFHSGLLEPLGNKRLTDLVAQMRDQQRLFGLRAIVHSTAFHASASEHRAILNAVMVGDKAAAESLTLSHLKHTRADWAAPTAEHPRP
jgi:DNA-binding GntR family transcriptional regulator